MLSAASGKGHSVFWQRAGFARLKHYTNTYKVIKLELIQAIISSFNSQVNIEKNHAMLAHPIKRQIRP